MVMDDLSARANPIQFRMGTAPKKGNSDVAARTTKADLNYRYFAAGAWRIPQSRIENILSAQLSPESAIVLHQPQGVGRFWNLRQHVPAVPCLLEQREEFAPGVLTPEFIDVAVADPRLEEIECRLYRFAAHQVSWV